MRARMNGVCKLISTWGNFIKGRKTKRKKNNNNQLSNKSKLYLKRRNKNQNSIRKELKLGGGDESH